VQVVTEITLDKLKTVAQMVANFHVVLNDCSKHQSQHQFKLLLRLVYTIMFASRILMLVNFAFFHCALASYVIAQTFENKN